MSNKILPDQHYIDQIRKRLWCGKECGKVAVMIGAGFSLNANKISQNSAKFLVWNELIREMKSDLYPYENIEINTGTSEALKLAREYELVFGRQALDELILRALPDQNYVPGDLHRLLLSLPWSDVFTTNYDTLLERTRVYIHDRKYDLVLTSADLPTTSKPRIVKLHGSFPSNRPFIITEEDYRTYPQKFSAFINTVQQSIMENCLCLIGFSGDDPNFLNWIGWVRDNLGMSTPPIYFCGFVNQSVKRTLESRGIVPIDLSPLFTDEMYPGNLKYSKALEWFLLNLKYGKEFDIMKWPRLQEKTMSTVKEGLPQIPITNFENIENRKMAPISRFEFNKKELIELTDAWNKIRLAYPGWIIAPKEKREGIWINTERYYHDIINSLNHINIVEKINVLYELNWRFEISLMPITDVLASKIDSIIGEINPFENILITADGQVTFQDAEIKYSIKLDKSLIREVWVELVFALVKHSREEQNSIKFLEYINRLQIIVNQNIEWKARWYYERCLFTLITFDQNELRNMLNEWPATNDLPFWEIKRASILAEMGELKEAEKIAEEALNRIRLMVRTDQIDISVLSQEGWSMVLLKAIKDNNLYERSSSDFYERWAFLSSYGCNPWQEIEIVKEILKSSVPNYDRENRITKEFDRGRITKHFSIGNTIKEEIKLSYTFLRMLENAAVPFQCGNIDMFSKEIAKAAKWIKEYSPFLAISVMIRCNADKDLKDSITRLAVARLSQEEIKQYFDVFIPALEQAIDNEPIKGYSHVFFSRQIQNLSEIVSRLCIRFSKEQLDKVLKVAFKMYKSLRLQRDDLLNKYIGIIFERIFSTMSDNHKVEWLEELIKLSIQMEEEYKVNSQNYKVDLFRYISFSPEYNLQKSFEIDVLKRYISINLDMLSDVDKEVRERSLLRLIQLYNIKALTKEDENSFSQIIWERVCESTGMPDYSLLYKYSYLSLPVPSDKNVKEIMLNWLLTQEIPYIYNKTTNSEGRVQLSYSGGDEFTRYVIEWVRSIDSIFINDVKKTSLIDLNKVDAIKLLEKLNVWWRDQKSILLDKSRITIFGDNQEHIEHFITLLSIVIIPRVEKNDQDAIDKIKIILNDLENSGYITIFALPMLLNLNMYSESETKDKLTKALFSSDDKYVKSSIEAIVYWLWYGDKKQIPQMPNTLIDELINKLYLRKQPELVKITQYLINIVESIPYYLNDEQMERICIALEYLSYETDLNIILQNNFENLMQDRVDLTEQRYYSSKLARVIYELIQNVGKDFPECLKIWKEASKNDPLPEVRNLWCD